MNYFDLHCDTPYECYIKKQNFNNNCLAVCGGMADCFEKWIQTFAFWISDDVKNPWRLYKNMYCDFKDKLLDIPGNLTPLFAVEGGALIEDNIERIYTLKSDGIKFLTLTWNGENRIAGGSKSEKNLTDFGKRVILKMNELKIGCDLSHLNEKSFYAATELSDYPLATHSNCRALYNSKRNLYDEQIKILAQKGGIMGLCFYPEFLGENVFEEIYKNIYHICDMGLQDIISIGSDFDGAKMSKMLCCTRQVPGLYSFLAEKGFSYCLLNKIFYENAYKFVAKLC